MIVGTFIKELKRCDPDFDVQYCGEDAINVFTSIVAGKRVILLDGKKAISARDLIRKLQDISNQKMEVFFKDSWLINHITQNDEKVQLLF